MRSSLKVFPGNSASVDIAPHRKTSEKFCDGRNKEGSNAVCMEATEVAFQNRFKGQWLMTITTKIALGISAAALSLSLALAPAAFAQDKMGKDDGMKKDSMKKDAMSHDAMKKDDGMKRDGMMKKDGMKK
jgi:pentapeptide MXKDX repeat protein